MGENGESVGRGYLFWSGGVPAKSRERRMPAFAKSAMVKLRTIKSAADD